MTSPARILLSPLTRRLERLEHRNPTARQKRGDLSLWWLAFPVPLGVAAGLWALGWVDVARAVAALSCGLPFLLADPPFWTRLLRVDIYEEIGVGAMTAAAGERSSDG